jgi:FkbM family methyltransferase
VYRAIFPLPELALTKRIEEVFRDRESIFFLQIGTSDGVISDPLHPLLKRKPNWRGVFVEPIGFVFEKLKKNYRNSGRFIYENVAIAPNAGKQKFYSLSEEARDEKGEKLPFYYYQLGSFDLNHLLKHLDGRLAQFVTATEIECIPLATLLEKHRIDSIDLILIDTEGYDYKILAQVDFERYHPKVIVYEHTHLSDEEKNLALKLLTRFNYDLVEIKRDSIAIRKEK